MVEQPRKISLISPFIWAMLTLVVPNGASSFTPPDNLPFEKGRKNFRVIEEYLNTKYSEIENYFVQNELTLRLNINVYVHYRIGEEKYLEHKLELIEKFSHYLNSKKFYETKPLLCNPNIISKTNVLRSGTEKNNCSIQYLVLDSCEGPP